MRLRAVVVYLEKKYHLMLQFGCLYTSYKHIQTRDTDLVVFGTTEALELIPDDCVKVNCDPLVDPEWQNYRYINSLACLVSENSEFLDQYEFLLRTDLDTFLTPAWNLYYPNVYTVGRGSYVNDDVVKIKLKNIAKKLTLKHQGIHNLGSTHYGKSRSVREVCKLALSVARYIFNTEFKIDPGKWPSWYKGVTTMYSCELAINHLVDNLLQDQENLDYDSTSQLSIHDHAHIHCWHTNKLFSKFEFENKKYDHIEIENLDTSKINNYCLYLALKSKKELPWLTL